MRFAPHLLGLGLTALVACSVVNAPDDPQPANSDDGAGGATAEGCPDGFEACGAACVNTTNNPAHCGACDAACGSGEVCGIGQCLSGCPEGQVSCGGSCVDLQSDAAHCGTCDNACASDNSTATCTAGTCAFTCNAGFDDCDGDPSNGCEQDIDGDADHCGACGTQCIALAHAEAACAGGACVLGTCDAGFDNCDANGATGCEENIGSNDANCGACVGAACPAGQLCVNSVCGTTPRPKVLLCGNSNHDVTEYLPSGVTLSAGCDGDLDTQAIFVSRSGTNLLTNAINYVENGGILITEFQNADDIFNLVFPEMVTQGTFQGSCQDNISTVVRFSPSDQFWLDNTFVAMPMGETGCGADITSFPNVVRLAGWSTTTTSLAYRDLGAGRVWLVEADWQDNSIQQIQQTRDFLAYMVVHR